MQELTMEELVYMLNDASAVYYAGTGEKMSNKEWDEAFDRLKELEAKEGRVLPDSPTQNVGYQVVDELPKFKHTYPALSLDKTKDVDVFCNKFKEGQNSCDQSYKVRGVTVMYKEDGSTVQAYYTAGRLDKLVTRGNGEIGSVITHNAKCIHGLPLHIPFKGELVVRGEAVMSYQEFEKINSQFPPEQQYKNPRNLASATLTMLDSNEASQRHLCLQAFNLVNVKGDEYPSDVDVSFAARLWWLKSLGFNVVENHYADALLDEIDPASLKQVMNDMTNSVQNYTYPVDGLVVVLNNYEYASKLSGTEHHPHIMNGYAFKWADNAKETVLREIEWSPSRTGLLNPVAIFDPIELEGTTVKRASLHNLSVMRKMRIHIGNRLSVYKSNMIIPYVEKNLDYDSEEDYSTGYVESLIGYCPTCKTKATVITSSEGIETVICPNPDCPEKLIGNFVHFCSRDCIDIQGMSEETIKVLVDKGLVKEYADFFHLDSKPVISMLPGFGKVKWANMVKAADKAKDTDFIRFVTSLSIPNIGKGQAKILKKYIDTNYERLCNMCELDSEIYAPLVLLSKLGDIEFDFTAIDGFGEVLSTGLTSWLKEKFNFTSGKVTPEIRLYEELNFGNDTRPVLQSSSSNVTGKSLCITGKLVTFKNRQELIDKIESLGGKYIDSVSKKTDYLINNDTESNSGKNKKAKELGIPVISEQEFLELIR